MGRAAPSRGSVRLDVPTLGWLCAICPPCQHGLVRLQWIMPRLWQAPALKGLLSSELSLLLCGTESLAGLAAPTQGGCCQLGVCGASWVPFLVPWHSWAEDPVGSTREDGCVSSEAECSPVPPGRGGQRCVCQGATWHILLGQRRLRAGTDRSGAAQTRSCLWPWSCLAPCAAWQSVDVPFPSCLCLPRTPGLPARL